MMTIPTTIIPMTQKAYALYAWYDVETKLVTLAPPLPILGIVQWDTGDDPDEPPDPVEINRACWSYLVPVPISGQQQYIMRLGNLKKATYCDSITVIFPDIYTDEQIQSRIADLKLVTELEAKSQLMDEEHILSEAEFDQTLKEIQEEDALAQRSSYTVAGYAKLHGFTITPQGLARIEDQIQEWMKKEAAGNAPE
jgi:hypothetical protein